MNWNGTLQVKSTADLTSMPMWSPWPGEIWIGMVFGNWPSATLVSFTLMVTAAPLPNPPPPLQAKTTLELHLALRQRLFAGEREAVHGEVIVNKRGLVVADVRAHGPRVTAVQPRTSSASIQADLAAIAPGATTEGA